MANLTQIYHEAIKGPEEQQGTEKERQELEAQQQWSNWRQEPQVKAFLLELERARNNKVLAVADVALNVPDISENILRAMLVEIATIHRVLNATTDGKYKG